MSAEVELAARSAYGRLVAWLTSRCGSLQTAEDAVGDALAAALAQWPTAGVPDNPEAWLLTVARRRLVDHRRRHQRHEGHLPQLRFDAQLRLQLEAIEASDRPGRAGLPERRLELMFMCAHPHIPATVRTPLMLQAVLGLTAEQIGSAMLVSPQAMGQRLVRAKRRIEEAAVPFGAPPATELAQRAGYVLDAIYAAYGTGWDSAPDLGGGLHGLAGEAIWLAGLVVQLLPGLAEAKGLYALLCLCESRREARRTPDGNYVPLEEQDPSLWNTTLIAEGERALWLCAQHRQAGRYQNEAAIHSFHADRARTGVTDWASIHGAYDVLVNHFPTLGSQIGHAASLGRLGQPADALQQLDALPPDVVHRQQPYWAVRAWLLAEAGRVSEAHAAYDRAIGLSSDPAVRAWLTTQRGRLP